MQPQVGKCSYPSFKTELGNFSNQEDCAGYRALHFVEEQLERSVSLVASPPSSILRQIVGMEQNETLHPPVMKLEITYLHDP